MDTAICSLAVSSPRQHLSFLSFRNRKLSVEWNRPCSGCSGRPQLDDHVRMEEAKNHQATCEPSPMKESSQPDQPQQGLFAPRSRTPRSARALRKLVLLNLAVPSTHKLRDMRGMGNLPQMRESIDEPPEPNVLTLAPSLGRQELTKHPQFVPHLLGSRH